MSRLSSAESFFERLDQDPEFAEQQADAKPSRDVALMIVRLRMQLGLTQTEFARNAGVSQAYISSLESGASNPSLRALARVLRKNGITLRIEASIDETPATAEEPSPIESVRRAGGSKTGRLSA